MVCVECEYSNINFKRPPFKLKDKWEHCTFEKERQKENDRQKKHWGRLSNGTVSSMGQHFKTLIGFATEHSILSLKFNESVGTFSDCLTYR